MVSVALLIFTLLYCLVRLGLINQVNVVVVAVVKVVGELRCREKDIIRCYRCVGYWFWAFLHVIRVGFIRSPQTKLRSSLICNNLIMV